MVRQRTQLINALRGHLAEFGIIAAKGLTEIGELLPLIDDPADRRVPPLAKETLVLLVGQLRDTERRIVELERRLLVWHRSRRLTTIPGVGPITATALVATVGDPAFFTSARHFAACCTTARSSPSAATATACAKSAGPASCRRPDRCPNQSHNPTGPVPRVATGPVPDVV